MELSTPSTKVISVDDFLDIQDNPIQRDTKSHARMAIGKRGHLLHYSPTHALVSYATNGKNSWKLDAHTRAYLWQHELLEEPPHLIATIYKVEDEAEAIELYSHFDNQKATEVATHKIYGAIKYHKIKVASPTFLNASGLKTAMRFAISAHVNGLSITATGNLTEVELVNEFKRECKWLFGASEINYQGRKNMLGAGWTGALTLAALLLLRVHNNTALSFLEAVSNGGGEKSKGAYDAVELCTQYIRQMRNEGQLTTTMLPKHVLVIITCYEEWMGNRKHKDMNFLKGVRVLDRSICLEKISDWLLEHGHKDLKTIKRTQLELLEGELI